MATLTGLRALVRHLPDDPLHHLILTPRIRRHELACLLSDVKHDRTGFENRDWLAPVGRCVIHQCRHAVIRVNGKKVVSELITLADITFHHVVIDSAFFQLNRDLLAIWRWPVMQVQHQFSPVNE